MLRPILIIDDNPADVDILCHMLRGAEIRHPIESFSWAEEAMEHLAGLSVPEARNWQPLLCVLDVNMPGFRGIDVLHWIREHDAFASIPVLVCSSSDDAGDIRQAAHFGAQCYAVKYGSPDDWKEVIACAERFSGDRSERFSVPCNLLPKVAG